MAFDSRALATLTGNDAFTLWHYATNDTRAQTLAPGYFGAALDKLEPGHVILVVASDAISMLPVRSSAAIGSGLVLDAANAPLRAIAAAAPSFDISLQASAAVTGLALALLPARLTQGREIAVAASVVGAIASVVFSIRNATNAVVAGPVTVTPSNGAAAAILILPAIGSGYRLRVEAPGEPLLTTVSPPFAVTTPYALLLQNGSRLLLQQGGVLLLDP